MWKRGDKQTNKAINQQTDVGEGITFLAEQKQQWVVWAGFNGRTAVLDF